MNCNATNEGKNFVEGFAHIQGLLGDPEFQVYLAVHIEVNFSLPGGC